jgi:hypothetical protein
MEKTHHKKRFCSKTCARRDYWRRVCEDAQLLEKERERRRNDERRKRGTAATAIRVKGRRLASPNWMEGYDGPSPYPTSTLANIEAYAEVYG